MDFNYSFPIDLTPTEIPFGAKYFGKVQLQSKFGLDLQDFSVWIKHQLIYIKIISEHFLLHGRQTCHF